MKNRYITFCLGLCLLISLALPGSVLSAPYVYVADTAGSWVSVIDLATDSIVKKVLLGETSDPEVTDVNIGPRDVIMHPNQPPRLYVSNYTEGTVSVLDVSDPVNATEITEIAVGANPEGLAFSPDGSKLYVAHATFLDDGSTNPWSQRLTEINVDDTSGLDYHSISRTREFVRNDASAPHSMVVKEDNLGDLKAYITGRLADKLYIVDIEDLYWIDPTPGDITDNPPLQPLRTIDNLGSQADSKPHGLAVADNGLIFVACRATNELAIINTNTPLADIKQVTVGSSPSDVAIHPDGNSVYVLNSGDSTVSVIDISTTIYSSDPAPISVGADALSNPEYIAVGTNGNLAYVTGHDDNTLTLIDTATNTVSNTLDLADTSLDPNNLETNIGFQGVTSGDPVSYISVLDAKNFGEVTLYDEATGTFTVTNKGTEALTISAIGGLSSDFFTVSAGDCIGKTLGYLGTCTFTVTYVPTTPTTHLDSLAITSDAANLPSATVSVSGNGTTTGLATASTPVATGSAVSGSTVTFSWEESTDPFNRTLTYRVEVSKGDTLFNDNIYFTCDGSGVIIGGSALATVLFLGGALLTRKRKTWILAVIFAATTLLAACGGGGGGGGGTTPPPAGDITSQAYTIVDGVGTYYWRVAAVDSDGGVSEFSNILSFEIQ